MKQNFSSSFSRHLRAESLEERCLLAVYAGAETVMPGAAAAEEPSTVVTTMNDIVDPDDGLISFREAVEYAKELKTPVSFAAKSGICNLNSAVNITNDLVISAEWITFSPTGEGDYAALNVTGAALSMTGGTISGFSDSGIRAKDAELKLKALTISNCIASGDGGGICAVSSDLILEGDSFYYNSSASRGGGIFFDGGGNSLQLDSCYVIGNKAVGVDGIGGGIAAFGAGSFVISNSYVNTNRAEGGYGYGGGIYTDSSLQIDILTALGNYAFSTRDGGNSRGGAVCADVGGASLVISTANISGNRAAEGAGIYSAASLTAYNTTIAGNAANEGGFGGVYAVGDTHLYNTIAAMNNGGDVSVSEESLHSSVVGVDPLFTDFIPYATEDWDCWIAEYWNLIPTETSPAIDAGTDAFALKSDGVTLLEYDLNAMNRFNRTVDAGCFENQTVIVNTAEDITAEDEYMSLREAVDIANHSWITVTICIDPALQDAVFYLDSPLVVYGSFNLDGNGNMQIDGRGTTQLFNITSGEVTLSNLTLANGYAMEGGAIYGYDAGVNLTNCFVTGNQAETNGGAFSLLESSAVLNNVTFRDNSAGGDGGAVYSCDSFFMLSSSRLEENSAAGYGGGAAFRATYEDFRTNSFSAVTASGNSALSGGAVAVFGEARFKSDASDLVENTAAEMGGAVYNEGTFQSDRTRIAGNDAGLSAGGLYNSGSAVLSGTLLAGNRARQGSAAVSEGDLTFYNVTAAGNTAEADGYAVSSLGTDAVYNSIIAQNNGGDTNAESCISSLIGTDPLFYQFSLYKSADWKSDLYQMWDFTPLAVSAAVDAGDDQYALSSDGWNAWNDYAGNLRIVNASVDIGAVEAQNPPETPIIFGVVSAGANRHQITWSQSDTDVSYTVEYSIDGTQSRYLQVSETTALVTGLPYGKVISYRVQANGAGEQVSEWSESRQQRLCPMDIDGDGDISGPDRVLMAAAWLSSEGDDHWDPRCDVNGDGDVASADRAFLSLNWLKEADDETLIFPKPLAAEAVFSSLDWVNE